MRDQGRIKWFNFISGYGFIVPNNGGPDVMLHISTCQDCNYMPKNSDRVAYVACAGSTGRLKATLVEEMKNTS